MAKRSTAVRRRRLQNNPGVHPELRWWIALINRTQGFSTTSTTTSTTSTTSTTTTTTTSTTSSTTTA